MTVVVDTDLRLKAGKKPGGKTFGATTLDKSQVKVTVVESSSTPIKGNPKRCACALTRVTVKVVCVIGLNRKKIQLGYFDPATKKGVKGKVVDGMICPPDPKAFKLDEENVLVHECSHAEDIAEAIRARLAKELDKIVKADDKVKDPNLKTLTKTCLCTKQKKCEQRLRKQVQDRLTALAKAAFDKLLKEALGHGRKSGTEKKARDIQAKDLELRKKPGEKVKKTKLGKAKPIDVKKIKKLKKAAADALAKEAEEG